MEDMQIKRQTTLLNKYESYYESLTYVFRRLPFTITDLVLDLANLQNDKTQDFKVTIREKVATELRRLGHFYPTLFAQPINDRTRKRLLDFDTEPVLNLRYALRGNVEVEDNEFIMKSLLGTIDEIIKVIKGIMLGNNKLLLEKQDIDTLYQYLCDQHHSKNEEDLLMGTLFSDINKVSNPTLLEYLKRYIDDGTIWNKVKTEFTEESLWIRLQD